MESNRRKMIQIAVLVTGFAVGMAGLLNYFKYKAVADRIVTERLTFTGKQIEHSIQSSLALGLQFSELGTLPATLQRLRATDDLILGIKIFDAEGQPLYSTDQLRARQRVPESWLERSQRAGSEVWVVRDDRDAAVGMAIQNQFGLTLGHVAMRYSQSQVQEAAWQVGKQLALSTLGVFVVAASLASLLMMAVMQRLGKDAKRLEVALRSGDPARAAAAGHGGPFAQALRRFVETVRSAESQIIELRGQLHRGGEPR
jgi:hypothetical protein